MGFIVNGTPVGAATIWTGLMASMGGFLFGYDTGMISGLVIMDDFKLRFATCTTAGDPNSCSFGVYQEGTIVALLSVGTLVGSLIGAPIADRLGRRMAMSIECLIFSIGIIIQIAAFTSWQQIAVGRLISGLGVGALSIAVPIYQSETLPRQLRGAIVSTYQLAITAGILVAALVNLGSHTLAGAQQWRLTIGLALVFSVFLGVGIQLCPESPRWLAARHRDEEAVRSLARVRGVSGEVKDGNTNAYVDQDMREITDGVRYLESMPKAGWLTIFKVENKTLYRTVMGVVLQAGQQLTGANYFFYFGATLFSSSGASINGFQAQVILNAVNFICTFGGIYVMQRFGRRWPLIIGGIGNAVWLIVFAAAGVAIDPTQNQGIAKLLIISACFFIVSYATTWAPGVWCLMGESFSARTRAKQSGLSTASNWLWNFMIAFFTTPIVANIGYAYGFVFAGANLFMSVFVFFVLYEPKGLSLEAVDQMYCDPKCKPWTSTKWVPPGYAHREDAAASENKASDQATLVEHASEDGEAKHGGKKEVSNIA